MDISIPQDLRFDFFARAFAFFLRAFLVMILAVSIIASISSFVGSLVIQAGRLPIVPYIASILTNLIIELKVFCALAFGPIPRDPRAKGHSLFLYLKESC
jgi:hypothetical protein